jgi:hypothetical protein
MEQFDLEKLETALTFVGRIADGRNPINNEAADNDEVMNDPGIIRSMFFIKNILVELKNNNGIIGRTTAVRKKEFPIEALSCYKYSEDKTITRLVEQLNAGIDEKVYKKLSYRIVTDWLKKNGYLIETEDAKLGKKVTLATEKAQAVGIKHSLQTSMSGNTYYRIEYDKTGQEFVVQNLPAMIA